MKSRSFTVRKRMIEVGLATVRQFADKSDLSESVVSQWIGGKTVRPETLCKLAFGLNLTVEQIQTLFESGNHKAAG